MSTLDWGTGRYEQTAERLLPAARAVVDHASPAAGERVADLGCGTGNAALLAAERGARVTGVDPAARLLGVARTLAAEHGLDAAFVEGDAESIPLGDGEVDVVLSVFGVIFAPEPEAAAAEMARVTAPTGRIVLSAWIPEGTISRVVHAIREASGDDEGPPPFAWHDRDALAGLLGPHGFEVGMREERIAFRAESPRSYFDAETREHPPWRAARAELDSRGDFEPLCERVVKILEEGNEAPDAFQVTSRYVVATARRA